MHNELVTTGGDDGDAAGRARRLRDRRPVARSCGTGGPVAEPARSALEAVRPPVPPQLVKWRPPLSPRGEGGLPAPSQQTAVPGSSSLWRSLRRVFFTRFVKPPNPCGRGLGTLFQRGSSPPKHQDWPCAQPRSAAVLGRGLRGEAPELRLRAPRPPPLTGVVAGRPRVPVGRGGFADSVSPAPCMIVSPLAGWEAFLHDGPSVPSRGQPVPRAAA